MDTIARGNPAEAAVLNALVQAGLGVLVPFGDGQCFDLVAVLPNGELARIQVKSGRLRKGTVEFNTASTDHGRGRLHYRGRADLLAVHAHQLDRLFMVPADDCADFRGYLRLTPPANNQHKGIRMADDYELSRWLESVDPQKARSAPGRI